MIGLGEAGPISFDPPVLGDLEELLAEAEIGSDIQLINRLDQLALAASAPGRSSEVVAPLPRILRREKKMI